MKRKKKAGGAVTSQLRCGDTHPFGAMRGFVPLGGGEERVYREMREAIPVLDAAVGKMVRLCGGFEVKCRSPEAQERLNDFLANMPCGRGQMGIGGEAATAIGGNAQQAGKHQIAEGGMVVILSPLIGKLNIESKVLIVSLSIINLADIISSGGHIAELHGISLAVRHLEFRHRLRCFSDNPAI